MRKLERAGWMRYGIALLLVVVSVLLRLYIGKQAQSLPFIIAVVLSGWLGGLWPGVLANVITAAIANWYFAPTPTFAGFIQFSLGLGLILSLSLAIKHLYDGHTATVDAVLALKDGLDDRDRRLHESEENLRNETRVLKAILNSLGEGVVVADPDGKYLVFNPAAKEILGIDPISGPIQEWPKQYTLYLPDTVTPYPVEERPLARALHGYPANDVEVFVRNDKNPQGAWLSVTARPLRDDRGDSRGAVAVFRNISASKQAEEARRLAMEAAESANRAKSEFLSRMSHELRTPLNSILGFAQILQIGDLPPKQAESVEYIMKGGRHLLGLINEVLDIARIESGRLSLSPEPVRVSDALQQALDLVQPLATKRNVAIQVDDAAGSGRHVLADRQRLAQVLLNLLSNAVKYNRVGGAVTLRCETTQGERVRVKITDTGNGIAPEHLSKLFAPFERLDAEQSGVEGTGLGLALSKRLIEAMEGAIGVESTVGKGSTFWLDLRALDDPLDNIEQQTQTSLRALEAGTSSTTGTVLYIEDNSSNLRLMEHIITNRPHIRLIAAMQGTLGLELARAHRPNLILLDLHLPDIRGDEVLRHLRRDPRTAETPVVMVSADATPGQIDRLLAAGATDYLTKPLDVRRLLQLLDRTLKSSRSLDGREALSYATEDRSK